MKEIWKDIQGYEGLYQVSSLGRVKSLEKKITTYGTRSYTVKERILASGGKRYPHVKLYKDGKAKYPNIHRLVALAFIENANPNLFVNHINGIKNDNNVNNLEWVTPSENQIHSYRTLNNKGKLGWQKKK